MLCSVTKGTPSFTSLCLLRSNWQTGRYKVRAQGEQKWARQPLPRGWAPSTDAGWRPGREAQNSGLGHLWGGGAARHSGRASPATEILPPAGQAGDTPPKRRSDPGTILHLHRHQPGPSPRSAWTQAAASSALPVSDSPQGRHPTASRRVV